MSTLKKQAISGIIWTFAQQFSSQIINFVVQVILARLLLPEMFGLMAMLSVFIAIGNTLMDGGMTSSLIRSKVSDQLDYSTVFMTNLLVSFFVYFCTFISAPFISDFYEQSILTNILRVYALTFIFRSFVAVHIAKLTKEMNFKLQMKLQIPSTIIGSIVGLSMAYLGYGVWSLVWLNLIQAIVFSLQTWFFLPWKPSLIFNKEKFKYHFNFGYKLTLSGLIDTFYRNIYTIVIGKAFSPILVGYFNQAENMRLFPVQQISTVMGKVTYPLFSNITDDISLKRAYKISMKLQFLIVVPIMLLLIIVGEELFYILFGEKWLPAVPYFQILSIASIMLPLSIYNLNILKVKGRSDSLLKLEIIKKGIGLLAVFLAMPFGILTLVISYTLVSILNTFLNMIFSGKLINYSFYEQMNDCGRIFISGILSFLLVFVLKFYFFDYLNNNYILLFILSFLFLVSYLSILYIFDKDLIDVIKKIIK